MIQSLPYVTRPMEPGDIPSVVAIDQLSFPTPWPSSAYAYELNYAKDSRYTVLLRPGTPRSAPAKPKWRHWLLRSAGVFRDNGNIIGYLGVRRKKDASHISTIAVHPDWRCEGLGEYLLLLAIEQSLEQEAPRITLEVRASNRVAQNLYRKYGFRFSGTYRGYYRDGEDAWLMALEITGPGFQRRLAELRQASEQELRANRPTVGQTDSGAI